MLSTFLEWVGLKAKIHTAAAQPCFFKDGDIWWCALGENIGVEINGKGAMFSRPVLVFKKLSRHGLMAIPLSTKMKQGSWYIPITFQGREHIVNLAQARTMSSARLYRKMGELDEKDRDKVMLGFKNLYG